MKTREPPPIFQRLTMRSGDYDTVPIDVVMEYVQRLEAAFCAALADVACVEDVANGCRKYLDLRSEIESI